MSIVSENATPITENDDNHTAENFLARKKAEHRKRDDNDYVNILVGVIKDRACAEGELRHLEDHYRIIKLALDKVTMEMAQESPSLKPVFKAMTDMLSR